MINPIKDNILIELINNKGSTVDGIYIPNNADTPLLAKVIALGKCNKDTDGLEYEFICKPNNIIVVEKDAGTLITENNKQYKLIKEKDILLILK